MAHKAKARHRIKISASVRRPGNNHSAEDGVGNASALINRQGSSH